MVKKKESTNGSTANFSLRIKEFCIPPVADALVLGKKSPIGASGMHKALMLMNGTSFEHVSVEDDTIGDILVRSSLLKRVSKEKFSRLIIDRVKPLMTPQEVLHLDIEIELVLEGSL